MIPLSFPLSYQVKLSHSYCRNACGALRFVLPTELFRDKKQQRTEARALRSALPRRSGENMINTTSAQLCALCHQIRQRDEACTQGFMLCRLCITTATDRIRYQLISHDSEALRLVCKSEGKRKRNRTERQKELCALRPVAKCAPKGRKKRACVLRPCRASETGFVLRMDNNTESV